MFLIFWGAVMTFVGTPLLTYYFGKRWYCSWVCGCGGLAETMGDPWRQLSDKSKKAWRFERWIVHSVLVFIVVTTVLLWINSATSGAVFGEASMSLKKWYGFYIGAIFSGVIGVGFYPMMGAGCGAGSVARWRLCSGFSRGISQDSELPQTATSACHAGTVPRTARWA